MHVIDDGGTPSSTRWHIKWSNDVPFYENTQAGLQVFRSWKCSLEVVMTVPQGKGLCLLPLNPCPNLLGFFEVGIGRHDVKRVESMFGKNRHEGESGFHGGHVERDTPRLAVGVGRTVEQPRNPRCRSREFSCPITDMLKPIPVS